MAAYIVAVVNVKDAQRYQDYVVLAPAAIAKFGGRYLARGPISSVLEGSGLGANRVVVVEFPSIESAKSFYHSTEYQSAREKRIGAADFTMMLIEGY